MGNTALVRKRDEIRAAAISAAHERRRSGLIGGDIDVIARNFGDGLVPEVIQFLVSEILEKGKKEEGIFRIPADESLVQQVIRGLDAGILRAL